MTQPMLQIQEVEIPKGAKLLEDVFELTFDPKELVESDGEGKKPYLKGRLGLCDVATANRRVYPRKLMAREIGKLAEDMKERKVYGSLGHPSDGKTDLNSVSHFVTEAEIAKDGEIKGVIEFIPGTKAGDTALAIARAGGKLGVSSRGFGSTSTDTKGNEIVQEDYKLVTWDIVADPANAGAHPNFVVEHKENKDMDLDTLKKEHPELIEALKGEIESSARTHAREALREEFEEQLRKEGAAIREEAVSVARSQLLKDPEVAGSATAINRIKEVITPFIISEDENKEIARLRERNREAEQRIARQDEMIAEMKAESEELSGIAKELGYHLYLEREIGGAERFEQIMEMLGDVTGYKNLDSLEERVQEISSALSEEDEIKEQYEDKIAELEKRLSLVEDQRDKALKVGKQFGIRAYIERKIADNPRAIQLRSYLNEASPDTKEDVDKLVEIFNKANPTSDEFNRIREGLKPRIKRPRDIDVPSHLNEDAIMGVPIVELQKRAGIQSQGNN